MKLVSMFLALATAAGVATAAENAPKLSRLYEVEVAAQSSAEFYAAQREIAEVYRTNKGPHARLAWTTLTGEAKFYYLVPLAGLDKITERTWLSQQGEEGARQSRSTRLRNSSGPLSNRILSEQPGPTWDPTPDGAPDAFAVISTYVVKPGKVADFLALAKEATEATKKAGKAKSVYVTRVNFGGDAYEFNVVHGYAALGDITYGALREAMGQAAYEAYTKKMGETISSLRREIIRYRPEFSYLPAK
jgi:hypothetical protein